MSQKMSLDTLKICPRNFFDETGPRTQKQWSALSCDSYYSPLLTARPIKAKTVKMSFVKENLAGNGQLE